MKKKKLSIVVPTKNRYYYLKQLIRLVASFESQDIELVIQDNSDSNEEFVEYLKINQYDFIVYNYIAGNIPMSDNADLAIKSSFGEFVCFIGDDDGVTKYILDCVLWMKLEGIEAVKFKPINYCWPDAPQGRKAAILYYPIKYKVQYLTPEEELINVLKAGICDRGNMPLAYHSIVSREVLDKVYNICGTYFPGNSPDISNAVALSLVVKKFALIDLPIAYSGSSAYKGGGVYARGNAAPEIDQIPWFRSEPSKRWDKELPRIAAGSIIWADSALEALRRMGRSDLRKYFNKNKCYANLIVSMPHLSNYVYEVSGKNIQLFTSCVIAFIKKYYLGVKFKLGGIFRFRFAPHFIDNINNINEASNSLHTLFDNRLFKS